MFLRAYNTGNFGTPTPEELIVANFEEIGRKIDRELKKLGRYLEKEVKPVTQRKAAAALRKASERLAEAARELELLAARTKK